MNSIKMLYNSRQCDCVHHIVIVYGIKVYVYLQCISRRLNQYFNIIYNYKDQVGLGKSGVRVVISTQIVYNTVSSNIKTIFVLASVVSVCGKHTQNKIVMFSRNSEIIKFKDKNIPLQIFIL